MAEIQTYVKLTCLAAALLAGCAHAPYKYKPWPAKSGEAAQDLRAYLDHKLNRAEGGYQIQGLVIDKSDLDEFYLVQRAQKEAEWASNGDLFISSGGLLALALEGVAIALAINADANSPTKAAGWIGLLPAGLVGFTFYWIGDNYFRKPSVALYNKRLTERLGMTMVPND